MVNGGVSLKFAKREAYFLLQNYRFKLQLAFKTTKINATFLY